MARPTELRTCHVQKNPKDLVDIETPDGVVPCPPDGYIVSDSAGSQWVFTESELKALAGAKPRPTPTPLPGRVIPPQ